MKIQLQPPAPLYASASGSLLHGGKLYFGVAGANPVTSPITVYWDAALTQQASQPISTLGGMPARSGNPAPVFVSNAVAEYSVLAQEADGRQAYYAPHVITDQSATELAALLAASSLTSEGAGAVGYNQSLAYAAGTVGDALRRFRTLAPSGGDDTSAIQTLADASDGYTLRFTPGTYTITTGIVMPAQTGIYLEPGAVIDMSGCAYQAAAFSWTGSEETAYNLTVNATKGAFTVTISSANLIASGIASGDWIRVASNEVFDSLRTSSEIGELIKVDSVDTGTGVITTETPLADSYATADTAQVSKCVLVQGAYVDGPGKIWSDKDPADRHKAIQVFLGYRPYVGNVQIEGMSDRAIWFRDCPRFLIDGPHFEDFLASTTAYGISVDNCCQDGLAVNFTARKVRHLLTTVNSTATRGIPRRIIFSNWSIEDTSYAIGGSMGGGDAVDTHAAAEQIHLWNGVIRGASNQGVSTECASGSLVNIFVYGSLDNGISVANQTDRPGDWVIENVHSVDAGVHGVVVTPVNAGFERLVMRNVGATDPVDVGVYVNGNATHAIDWLDADGLYAVRPQSVSAGVYVDNVSGGSIRGVRVQEPTETGVHALRILDSKRLAINGVTGKLAASATGSLVYFNASAAGLCSDIVIDGMNGESPTAVSSRGILIDNDAQRITVGPARQLDAFTTPISWGSGSGHKGGQQSGSATLAAGTYAVTFAQAMPANYSITLAGNANETFRWSAKATTGFTITSSNAGSTAGVDWRVEV